MSWFFLAGCREGWAASSTRCYKYFGVNRIYDDAQQICTDNSAELAKILTQLDNDVAAGEISNPETFIGWKDNQWSDGTGMEDWRPKWHSNNGGCTRLVPTSHGWKPGQWDDWSCDKSSKFLCSYDLPEGFF